jgi:hypothetical protein
MEVEAMGKNIKVTLYQEIPILKKRVQAAQAIIVNLQKDI